MSEIGNAVPVYAAVVATAGLAWQIWRAVKDRRPDIRVDVKPCLVETDIGFAPGVTVIAGNYGRRPVAIAAAGIDPQSGTDRCECFGIAFLNPVTGTIPTTVEPHDVAESQFTLAQLASVGLAETAPLTAWVQVATGEVVRSRPRQLVCDATNLDPMPALPPRL